MSRTFQDENLLVWEAFPSGGDFGFPDRPYVVFNCLTNRMMRPRVLQLNGDEADAERLIVTAPQEVLRELFSRAREID